MPKEKPTRAEVEHPAPESFHRVSSEAQARMLIDSRVRDLFNPFLGQERTVGEAAAEAGCSPAVMLYRVGVFLRAGLLRVAGERPRAGRPLKVYRSVHDAYFIPYALTPYADLEEVFRTSFRATSDRIAALAARRYRGLPWDGFRVYRRPGGEVWAEGTPDASEAVWPERDEGHLGTDFATELLLSEEEAFALQAQLLGFLQRGRSGEGRKPYLLSVAFMPLDAED